MFSRAAYSLNSLAKSQNTSNTAVNIFSFSKRYKSKNGMMPEHPFRRAARILKNDIKNIPSFLKGTYRPEDHYFKQHCDVAIIGGGIMGSSIAYWLTERVFGGLDVVVIERDPTYTQASTVLSAGGLRQQFSLPENIQMSMYGAEFLRNMNSILDVDGDPPPDVCFTPYGYLFLASPEGAETLEENFKIQKELGVNCELLTPEKLTKKFPWISTNGIALGCHGLQNEGWFDPWALLAAFKRKAVSQGTNYLDAEVVGFEDERMDVVMDGVEPGKYRKLTKVLVKTKSGEVKSITFAMCIIAAGAWSGEVAKLAGIGTGSGYLEVPLTIEPRKRYVYCFHAPKGPGLDTPLVIDPTGTYFRREGLGGVYIGGRSPEESDEPSTDNMDVDYEYFDKEVWPVLASRVPGFEELKIKSAWSGFYDYNAFDANGIIGSHPYHHNVFIASGFSGHGLQQAPAVGRAISELILDGYFKTIDLSRLSFDRIYLDEPVFERNIV